jgi:hypothetical protein
VSAVAARHGRSSRHHFLTADARAKPGITRWDPRITTPDMQWPARRSEPRGSLSVCRCDFAELLSIFGQLWGRVRPGAACAPGWFKGRYRADDAARLGNRLHHCVDCRSWSGQYFIDWNQFRPQFEAEATRILGTPVRVGGKLDARLLPAPSLQLRSVVVGGANDLGKVRADKLDVEFSLGSLMRGEVRATELTINGLSLDLGLDAKGAHRLAGLDRDGQSGLAGDRPAQSHRPHRPARRGQPLYARAERYRLQWRRAVAGRLGPRRRQLHAQGHALSVSHFLGAGPRWQRHPRSSQY